MASEITPTTKVNLGILGTLLVVGFGCGVYLTVLDTTVRGVDTTMRNGFVALDKQLSEIKTELRDGSAATALLNRAVATIEARLDAFEKRITVLEGKSR